MWTAGEFSGQLEISKARSRRTKTKSSDKMETIQSLKRNDIVTLTRDCSPMSGYVFKAGDKMKFLGWYGGTGNLARLSRVGDNARLMVIPADIGVENEVAEAAHQHDTAKEENYDAPHSDESGESRFVKTHSVLAGKHSGVFGMHFTPNEEREYNRGMAMLAEL